MEESNYKNSHYQLHLMEQYKLYVEMTDRISVRRGQANTFYISLLSALLALPTLVVDKGLFAGPLSLLLFLTSFLGLTLCLTWHVNLQSYKQLNRLKFKVINEMEKTLPFPCYSREWAILNENQSDNDVKYNNNVRYIRLTTVEKYIPLIFSLPYVGLLLYTLLIFLGIIDG